MAFSLSVVIQFIFASARDRLYILLLKRKHKFPAPDGTIEDVMGVHCSVAPPLAVGATTGRRKIKTNTHTLYPVQNNTEFFSRIPLINNTRDANSKIASS